MISLLFLLLGSIDEHSNAVEVALLRNLIGCTETLNSDAVGSNLILLDESVLNNISTVDRELVVQVNRTLGRSVAAADNLRIGMVAHVLGNHLNACILSGINNALTLTEDNNGLEEVLLLLYNLYRTRLTLSELSLQVGDGLSVSSNLAILGIDVSTELVDLSVQTVDLSLVAELSNLEVVSAVAVAELVVDTA